MHTVSRSYFTALAQALIRAGAQVDPHDPILAESGRHIRLVRVYDWLEGVVERTGDEDIGVRVHAHAHPAMLGQLGYAVMSCATLGDALQRLAAFHPLTTNGSILRLEQHQGDMRLIGFEVGPPAPRSFIDAGAAMTLGLLRWLTPACHFMPLEVELAYPQPQDITALRGLFGDRLVFGRPYNSVRLSKEVCRLPLPTASPTLDRLHGEYAAARLEERIEGSAVARVRRALTELLTMGQPIALENLAGHLRLSRRSLQNALEREGVSFSALLDEARLTQAHSLLCDSVRSIKYIGATLGFRDPSSFHKACLRWFGMPPGEYRRLPRL
ncbi:AraC family transcriptional regulator [Pseudomonas xanthosomatis]|uniref:AraC family transcriptional regulator n=1 Tax=Pseudomonas xanthosomatis TaxID=2842356 RepID=UPI001C3C540B|nr:AraC family transcriptional regulator [Pseudomonas xanthosomatis]QXH44142.1 AraC family transcriptional regulator [Pseudomonas xanthosomatis]